MARHYAQERRSKAGFARAAAWKTALGSPHSCLHSIALRLLPERRASGTACPFSCGRCTHRCDLRHALRHLAIGQPLVRARLARRLVVGSVPARACAGLQFEQRHEGVGDCRSPKAVAFSCRAPRQPGATPAARPDAAARLMAGSATSGPCFGHTAAQRMSLGIASHTAGSGSRGASAAAQPCAPCGLSRRPR